MNDVLTFIISRVNYFIYIILMVLGMYGIIVKNNLLKKIIGMNILQTAIILFFISIGAKNKATVPIVEHAHGAENHAIHAVNYINPLPHVLMLTAIVVAVATLGVALTLIIRLHRQYNTLEEDEILAQLKED